MKNILLIAFTIAQSTFLYSQHFDLKDYYSNSSRLNELADSIYNTLSDTSRVGQMIITSYGHNGKTKDHVDPLIKANKVGGVIYLKGTHQEHFDNTQKLNKLNTGLPLLFSMDAEPSLMKGRISTLDGIPKTNAIKTISENEAVAKKISNELNAIGVRLNFAPDCDMSTSNAAIGSRSYGNERDTIVSKVNSFINTSTQLGISTCAKHFPGHGLVTGDSHHQRVFIDGELKELDVYRGLLNNPNLITVMIGHIDIINNKRYNTNGRPSSCSPLIIKTLLQQELGFKGIVISDALGMKALREFKSPGLEASKAGCDFLCMPQDENKLLASILEEAKKNQNYAKQIELSIKKVIRLKLCLGLIHEKPTGKIISYQHGKIVESQGVNAISPTYGKYEYTKIIERFKKEGYGVIGTVREKDSDTEHRISRLTQQIDSLRIYGYKPENITLLGASKGAALTLYTSTRLSTTNVNIVVLGVCSEWTKKYFDDNDLQLHGRIFSIYEVSDKWNQSCRLINYGTGITEFKELKINTNLQHGFLFKPLDEWVLPTIDWIENKSLK